jgi:Glyoxalase-like domain
MPIPEEPLVLDHIVIGVHDKLDDAESLYRRLGFNLTPRGYHTLGSINHLAIFGDNYLELLGVPPGAPEVRPVLWSSTPGLSGLAFKAKDAARLHDALADAGKAVEDWNSFSRPVVVDGKTKHASFRTFQIGRNVFSNGRFFFCQHETPELVYRDADRGHPNGAEAITDVFIVSRNAAALLDLFDAFPAKPTTSSSLDGIKLPAGTATLHILTPDEAQLRFAAALPENLDQTHRLVAVAFRSASLGKTERALRDGAVDFEKSEQELFVAAAQANGVTLVFHDRP